MLVSSKPRRTLHLDATGASAVPLIARVSVTVLLAVIAGVGLALALGHALFYLRSPRTSIASTSA